jgi:hypothetical protein
MIALKAFKKVWDDYIRRSFPNAPFVDRVTLRKFVADYEQAKGEARLQAFADLRQALDDEADKFLGNSDYWIKREDALAIVDKYTVGL